MTKFQPPGAPPAATAGPGTDEAGTVPLTEEQLGLLRRHRADPRNSPNVPLAIDLRGPLDDGDLDSALARLVARHPLLSARVRDGADGLPYLDVDPARVPCLERRTTAVLGHAPTPALLAEGRQELDLERVGVLRAVLLAHGPEHHTLLLVVHHVVVDGELAGLLLADLLGAREYGGIPGAAPTGFGARVTARAHEAVQTTDTTDATEATADDAAGANGRERSDEAPLDVPQTVPVTPQQRGLLLDALAHRGTGRYVQQLFWRWHGPLDTDRFTAAWQSVFDCETVLRAAFDWGEEPVIVVHDHAAAEVVRHPTGTVDWDEVIERDRLRGFDLRVPGLLRATLVDDTYDTYGSGGTEGSGAGRTPSTRVLITFHHVLLDGWSVSVLVQEFYRAYLAGGSLPGSERRPDIRDYARWLGEQDTAPAREFWSAAVPSAAPAVRPALPGPATGQRGWGRAEVRLTRAESDRLRAWAAARAATESGALQAVWALLLYRAGGAEGPAPVGFGVGVSGRGICLDAVERLPGLLMNSLPVIIEVDPRHTVPRLLTELRDQALDAAAYEWVSTGQIHEWSGRGAGEKLVESLLVFENHPRSSPALESVLAAHGIRVGLPEAAGFQTAFPVTLLAHPDADGGLLLTAVHDRGRIADADAGRLVGLCARLLRELPVTADESTTVADIVAGLLEADLPRMSDRAEPVAGVAGADVTWPEGPQTQVLNTRLPEGRGFSPSGLCGDS